MASNQSSIGSVRRFGDAHLAAIIDSSTDAIVSKDLDGIVQTWNRAAERIFGWTEAEIVGRSIRTLIPDDRQAEEDDILARIRAGEIVPKFDTIRLHKDGSPIPVAVTVSPIRCEDGTIIGASKIAHDIREQVETTRKLAESEARFRALAENIPQLAWMGDPSGHLFWYNQRWYDFTGTTFEEMEGWGWEKVHHPDHVQRVVDKWQAALAAGESWEDTFPLLGKDGRYHWFLSRAMPIRDANGDVTLWFGTNTDITQQREHEQQIELLMGEVKHRAKNMLAIVQAILHRTAGGVDPAFVSGFEKRIAALSANQDLLIQRGWAGVPIGDIVRSQLGAIEDFIGNRIELSGPDDMILAPPAAEALGLAIHELATNAVKYGSLSNDTGRLDIDWQEGGTADDPRFRFSWREAGGPPVGEPGKAGFGTILITRNPKSVLGGEITLDYRPEGLVWEVDAPLKKVVG